MGTFVEGVFGNDVIGDDLYDVTIVGTMTDRFTLIFSIFYCIFQINDKIQQNLSKIY